MAIDWLKPDGDGTTGSWTATPLWSKVDDYSTNDGAFVDDGQTITSPNNADGSCFLTLDTTNGTWISTTGNVSQVRVKITKSENHEGVSGGQDTSNLYVQLFKTDETTALTNEVQVGTGTVTDGFITLTITGTPTQSDWDGARLRLRHDYIVSGCADTTTSTTVTAVIVELTYMELGEVAPLLRLPLEVPRAKKLPVAAMMAVAFVPIVTAAAATNAPGNSNQDIVFPTRVLQYESVVGPVSVPVTAETITADKWYPRYPDRVPGAIRIPSGWTLDEPVYVPDVTDPSPPLAWDADYPDQPGRKALRTAEYASHFEPVYVPDVTDPAPNLSWNPEYPDSALPVNPVPAFQAYAGPERTPDVVESVPELAWNSIYPDFALASRRTPHFQAFVEPERYPDLPPAPELSWKAQYPDRVIAAARTSNFPAYAGPDRTPDPTVTSIAAGNVDSDIIRPTQLLFYEAVVGPVSVPAEVPFDPTGFPWVQLPDAPAERTVAPQAQFVAWNTDTPAPPPVFDPANFPWTAANAPVQRRKWHPAYGEAYSGPIPEKVMISFSFPDEILTKQRRIAARQQFVAWNPNTPAAAPFDPSNFPWVQLPDAPAERNVASQAQAVAWSTHTPAEAPAFDPANFPWTAANPLPEKRKWHPAYGEAQARPIFQEAAVSFSFPDEVLRKPGYATAQQQAVAWNPNTPAAAPFDPANFPWTQLPADPVIREAALSAPALAWNPDTPAFVTDLSWSPEYPDIIVKAKPAIEGISGGPIYVPDVTVVTPALSWQPQYPDRVIRIHPTGTYVDVVEPILLIQTRGLLSFAELESPFVATRGRISWAEVETPLVPTRGRISWVEVESPLAPTRGRTSFSEFEAPLVATRGRISWTEFAFEEIATAGNSNRIGFQLIQGYFVDDFDV